jgi:hypothetical protein
MVEPKLMPRYTDAITADVIAAEQGRIATDTRNRLIRLQKWIDGWVKRND